jgi:hypothetical protein
MTGFFLNTAWFAALSAFAIYCSYRYKKLHESADTDFDDTYMWVGGSICSGLLAVVVIFDQVIIPAFQSLLAFMQPLGSGFLPLITAGLIMLIAVMAYLLMLSAPMAFSDK